MKKKVFVMTFLLIVMFLIQSCSISTLDDYEEWLLSDQAMDFNNDKKINKEDYDIYLDGSIVDTYIEVTFQSNGGSVVASKQIVKGETIEIPINPTRAGFYFAGWYQDSSFNQKFDFTTRIDSNIILYALWQTETERLREYFMANGTYSVTESPHYSINFYPNSTDTYNMKFFLVDNSVLFTLMIYDNNYLFHFYIGGIYGECNYLFFSGYFPGRTVDSRYHGYTASTMYIIRENILYMSFENWDGPISAKASAENLAKILVQDALEYFKTNVYDSAGVPFK